MLNDFLNNYLIIEFIFLFISISLLWELFDYYNRNLALKKILLIILSCSFIIWLDIGSFIIMLVLSTLIFFIIKRKIHIEKNLFPIVIFLILLLLIFKDYYLFFELQNPYIPLGVSYYFFRLTSFLIDYTKNEEAYSQISALKYFMYVFHFPIFLAGPIQRFNEFDTLSRKDNLRNKPKYYSILFVVIIAKLFVADYLLRDLFIYDIRENYLPLLGENPFHDRLFLFWIHGLSSFIYGYLDLMLYTEISKSFSRILGFSAVDNFNKPLLVTNISMFWQRWHMSLSNWTRDYIFFPTLIKTRKTWLASYLSMLMIGMWHSIRVNWIAWALLHGTAINLYGKIKSTLIYKNINKNRIQRRFLGFVGNLVTINFVAIVYNLVAVNDMQFVYQLIKNLVVYGK